MWAQLGLAADHVDFIDFVSEYASQHPSSKTTTELLFLVDKLAQASLDALVTLGGHRARSRSAVDAEGKPRRV